jgi:hypothetical protein
VSSRAKTLLSGVVTVVALAAVIGGIYAFSAPRHQAIPRTIQLTPSQRSMEAFQQGQKALASKDTTGAISLFEKAINLDPDNDSAKDALKDAKAQQSSGQTTSSGSAEQNTKKKTAAADPWAAVVTPRSVLPTTFPDYALGSVEADGPDATVSGSPTRAGAKVTSVVWSVHDSATTAKSEAFLNSVTKTLYPKDAASIKVNGVTAYFGTNGTRFASVAFNRNRYVFEVVLTSTDSPVSARALAEQAAAKFPTQP